MNLYPFFIPHAGCPHRCRFCQQQRLSGENVVPSPAEVGVQLAAMLPKQGDGEVAYYGGSFTLLEPALQRAYLGQVQPFIAGGRVAGVRVSTRPDAIDAQRLALLVEGGVTTVELGCQSFCPAVLAASGRGHDAEAAARAVSLLRCESLQVGLQLMPGLPAGDRREALLSLFRALALAPDFLRIYPAVVLKDTALEKDFACGRYQPLELEEAVDLCAEMLWHCRRVKVPVVRLGLQASDALNFGYSLVAGPYHPAFGALVRSRLWRQALEAVLAPATGGEVRVHPADLSDALGHRRANRDHFAQRGRDLVFRGDRDVAREHFTVAGRLHALQAAAGSVLYR